MKFTVSNILTLLLVVSIYGILIFFLHGKIPDAATIIQFIRELYKTYGYFIVFFGAILEGIFLVGNYVPGSAVILLGAAISRSGELQFPLIILFGNIGLQIGYSINYMLGRYGWYHVLARFGLEAGIDKTKKKLEENDRKTIFLGYISITTAAFVSTAAGVLRMPFKRFMILSIISQLCWSLLWGSIAYFLGFAIVEIALKYFAYIALAIGIVWIVKYVLK